jgi:nifR3 family TIM-barrel protein
MPIQQINIPRRPDNSQPDFLIGSIPIRGRLALAPMDGISDQPFRAICRKMGSAFSVTEFINVQDVPQSRKYLARRSSFTEIERLVGFQLYGRDPRLFLDAALRLREKDPDFFDINLGCSVRGIANAGAGAGLLRHPEKISEIFSLLVKNLDIPVTAKIRLGWDASSRNFIEISRLLEDHGAAMIAVHGRTACDRWVHPADWQPIAEIKQTIRIPVIGNGDVNNAADSNRMLTETGCDGVLIGRGALGNPWIFARIEKTQIPREEIINFALAHWERMATFYGEDLAQRMFRKHIKAYFSVPQFNAGLVREILKSPQPVDHLANLI